MIISLKVMLPVLCVKVDRQIVASEKLVTTPQASLNAQMVTFTMNEYYINLT